MTAYYNEIDGYCCDWLSNLMDAGHITPGKIDDRSIVDVPPDDVRGYERVHWFAGIAGWDLALNLAGWGDRPVWTGSCPCQPFSVAGKGAGGKDERHLWPYWFRLIRECQPAIVFGEQVAAAIGWGWLDVVLGDLEAEGYAAGAAVLGAHSVGAPHIRQRLWFVADALHPGRPQGRPIAGNGQAASGGATGLLADAGHQHARRPASPGEEEARGSFGDATGCSPWSDLVWFPCSDGKARPTEPGIFPFGFRVTQ